MGGVFKKYGERFAGLETVRHEDVDPWNSWPHTVDSHKNMTIPGVGEASVKADLNVRASSPEGCWFGLFSGFRDNCDDGVKGTIIPSGAFIVRDSGASARAEGRGSMGMTEVEKRMLDSALVPYFSS